MGKYLFGCIILSLISALLIEGAPKSLSPGVKSAVGVGLIVFAAIPLGGMIGNALSHPFPDFSVPDYGSSEFHETSKEAYKEGVTAALCDRYSLKSKDLIITVDGFDSKELSAEIMHVTLTGEAIYTDYRDLKEYVETNLKVARCDVQIEFS